MDQIPEWVQVSIVIIILGAAFAATKKRLAKNKQNSPEQK